MTSLVETPVPVILFGIVGEAVLGIILLRTGRGALLWAMGGVLAVVLAGVLLEGLVVTDREEVEAALEDVAAAIEANDPAPLLDGNLYLTDSATQSRAIIRWGMDRVDFTRVKITSLDITINRLTSPPTARAQVQGIVYFHDRHGDFPYESYPLKELVVELRQQSGRWLISGHQWSQDPRR
jgi:hypothetical protein